MRTVNQIRDWSISTGGGGGGWAGAFRNVVNRKHMTHPFQLEQNGVTHPLMKAENHMTHPPIRHGSIIRKKSHFVDEIVVLFTI